LVTIPLGLGWRSGAVIMRSRPRERKMWIGRKRRRVGGREKGDVRSFRGGGERERSDEMVDKGDGTSVVERAGDDMGDAGSWV
jgi:hypothetical protein